MDILIQELQQNIGCVEFRLSQLAVKIKTPILIDYLQQNKVDYTLLMYLQVDENFTKNKAFISYLKGLCEQMCVPYKNRAFYDLVWNHFKANGVQSITPNKFIINRNKEDILHEYQRIVACNEWRQHNPFFFQTFITTKSVKGFQKLVFFITRTWQDGVIRMLEILKEGNFVLGTNMFDAHGVFEHFIDDDTLTGLMLDSELLSRALPALSADEISAEMLRFPAMISHDLVAQGLLHDESFLHVTVKDKTRPRGDCIKVSFHFLLHVCATKSQQKRVIEQFMRERKKEIDKGLLHMKETKTLPEDRALPIAWYAFDAKAATSNGFTTPFARKDRSDPYSRKHSDAVYCLGMQISETLCPVNVQDLHGRDLTDSERLCLLQEQLYTTPKLHMASYAVELKETEKVITTIELILFLFICPAIGIRTLDTPIGGRKKNVGPFPLSRKRDAVRTAGGCRRRSSTCQHGSCQRSVTSPAGGWRSTRHPPLSNANGPPSLRPPNPVLGSTRSLPPGAPTV